MTQANEIERRYATATHVYAEIKKRGVQDNAVAADWTPVATDVKISKDGGAAANTTNPPVAIAMGNTAYWDFSLTAGEMTAAKIVVTVGDAATKAVEDVCFSIVTYGHASAERLFNYAAPAASVLAAGIDTGALTAGALAVMADAAADGVLDALLVDHNLAATFGERFNTFDKTGYALSTAGIDAILDRPIAEPSAIYTWPASLRTIQAFMGALMRNKHTGTATTHVLRNDADSATIATATVSDNGTTLTYNEWT